MTKLKTSHNCSSDHILQISKLTKTVCTKSLKVIITGSVLYLWDVDVISLQITLNLH